MKKLISFSLAVLLSVSVFTMAAFASDTDAETTKSTPETKTSTVVEENEDAEKVLCVKCNKKMHTDFEKEPAYYSEWGVIDTFVCNHWNGGMYTVDELLQRLVVKTYFCDDCGTKQIVATHEYKDRCNFKK